MATHALNPESGLKIVQNRSGTALLRVYKKKFFGTVPRLPEPRLPPRDIIFGHVAFTCRKLGVPCQKVAGTVPTFWCAVPIFQRV